MSAPLINVYRHICRAHNSYVGRLSWITSRPWHPPGNVAYGAPQTKEEEIEKLRGAIRECREIMEELRPVLAETTNLPVENLPP